MTKRKTFANQTRIEQKADNTEPTNWNNSINWAIIELTNALQLTWSKTFRVVYFFYLLQLIEAPTLEDTMTNTGLVRIEKMFEKLTALRPNYEAEELFIRPQLLFVLRWRACPDCLDRSDNLIIGGEDKRRICQRV